MTLCSLVSGINVSEDSDEHSLDKYPKNGGGKFHRNIGTKLQDYVMP
jgi:hypothetical protein